MSQEETVFIFSFGKFQCEWVGKDPVSLEALQVLTYHTEKTRKFSCVACPKEYYSKARLEDHVKTKHEAIQRFLRSEESDSSEPPRVIFCDLCPQTFATETRMFEHKTYMHSITCAILMCPKCDKSFETKRAFQKHTTALHRDLVCNECPKKLGSSRSLREHKKRTHVPVNLEPQQVVGGALGENTS